MNKFYKKLILELKRVERLERVLFLLENQKVERDFGKDNELWVPLLIEAIQIQNEQKKTPPTSLFLIIGGSILVKIHSKQPKTPQIDIRGQYIVTGLRPGWVGPTCENNYFLQELDHARLWLRWPTFRIGPSFAWSPRQSKGLGGLRFSLARLDTDLGFLPCLYGGVIPDTTESYNA